MSTDKPCALYPNEAVTRRFDSLNEEVSYRQRVVSEVAEPLERGLQAAREARRRAAKELGVDIESIGKVWFVRGKGVFWEDEDWIFDPKTQDLVPRPNPVPEEPPAAKPARKKAAKKSTKKSSRKRR